MRQKLAKQIRRAAFDGRDPKQRAYARAGDTVVTDSYRAWYQRQKPGWTEKAHPAPKVGEGKRRKRRRALRRFQKSMKRHRPQ